MSFKISEFRGKIGSIAKPNLFYAELFYGTQFNNYKNNFGVDIGDTFKFRCEVAEIPGRTVATTEDTAGAGPALKLAYDITYNDINLTIICSEDMKEKLFFEQWMDVIVGKADTEVSGRLVGGLVSYHNEYAVGNKLIISQLNSKGEVIGKSTLHDVFPIAIAPMTANWEETNTYQRLGITMSYRYYDFSTS